jgi:hypothetical protein
MTCSSATQQKAHRTAQNGKSERVILALDKILDVTDYLQVMLKQILEPFVGPDLSWCYLSRWSPIKSYLLLFLLQEVVENFDKTLRKLQYTILFPV